MAAVALTIFAAVPARAHVASCDTSPRYNICAIHHWRDAVWRIEDAMGATRTRYAATAERSSSRAYQVWVRHLWYTRYLRWRKHESAQIVPRPIYDDFLCIHHYEGAWDDDTGNGYYGGLQMDYSFETTYGPEFYARWGNAGSWPPLDQIIAAYRAYRTRGFEPWPNTAAMCGLL